MNDKKITGECCGRPMQYVTESKCNYNNCCMDEYCGRKLGRIKEMEPTCDSTAVIPSITVESVEGITNLANCLVHVNDINTTFYVDDKHRVMITWAGPVDIPGYDMENNPNGYRDQIVTDIEKGIAVIYDKHGKGYTFGIYDSLDSDGAIAQAVNNKLDEMAADGTLADIISQYIGEPIFGFDTVVDMRASTTLRVGDRARTLGFYTIDDDGGALYKMIAKETPTANGNININDELDAQLINEGIANVKVFGAKGDNSTSDDAAFNNAVTYANSNNVKLYAPKGVYKLDTSSINLRNLNVEIEGELNNSYAIILGGNSSIYTNYNVCINKCKDVEVVGLKASEVSIDSCAHVVLSADGNISGNGSIAYCIFNIIDCIDLTITGQNNGWINENVFNIKRCRNFLKITGDGTYSHNNNFFRDICIEGDNHYIQIDYGHNNYINYRGEGEPNVILNNPNRTFGNSIRPQYAIDIQRILDPSLFNNHNTMNVTLPEWLPQYRQQTLVDINPNNYLESNSTVFLHSDNKLYGTNAYSCRVFDAPATEAFIIHLRCDTATQRMYITCKDSGGNAIPGNITSRWLTMNENTKIYSTSTNVSDMIAVFLPSDEVSTVSIDVRMVGTNLSFGKLNVDLFTAFTSNYSMYNTLSGRRKSQNPTALDANAVWKTGDWVLNRDTEQNQGTFAWVCSAGGTGSGSTWRKITSTTI